MTSIGARAPNNIDEHVRSVIFDSFGVSQGGTVAQEHAIYLFAAMNPAASAAFSQRLSSYDHKSYNNVANRNADFASTDMHGYTGSSVGGGNATFEAMGWLRHACKDEGVSRQAVYHRAVLLGSMMLDRDTLFANRGNRAKTVTEPARYSLYAANYNSHLLHYAYVIDPFKLPDQSMQTTAGYAARSFTGAIESSDTDVLIATGASQKTIEKLRTVTRWHLDHYPAHSEPVSPAFMNNVLGDDLLSQLPQQGPEYYPYICQLPQ